MIRAASGDGGGGEEVGGLWNIHKNTQEKKSWPSTPARSREYKAV